VLKSTLDRVGVLRETGVRASVGQWVRDQRFFLLIVVVPTLLVAAYLFLFASDQYVSEAHFIVRASQESPAVPTGLGQMLSLAGGVTESQSEALSVGDYLTSHDAVAALQDKVQLVQRFRRPEADLLSRLFWADPSPETLLKYYRKHVDVDFANDTGITTLRVRTFRPADSYAIVNALLDLGERRVNELNRRAYENTLSVARRELEEAEADVARSQTTITGFRQEKRDIDPMGVGEAQVRLVSELEATLAAARAQLASMAGSIKPDSPQYVALAQRVKALEVQVAAQSGRLAGNGQRKTIATDLGGYEELKLRQDFAAKRYASAAAALEQARERAMKQQLFVVRIVEPNMPVRSTYPERWTLLATVFFGLLLTYGIAWLIVAGVKEHAA
jgi:capsular polysaccharide transport system permease protein